MASVTGSLFQGVSRNSWAVLDPGIGAAALGNDRPEMGIGQHIDPWGGSHLIRLQRNDVFAAVAGEATAARLKN